MNVTECSHEPSSVIDLRKEQLELGAGESHQSRRGRTCPEQQFDATLSLLVGRHKNGNSVRWLERAGV